jgi:hypothetical protein
VQDTDPHTAAAFAQRAAELGHPRRCATSARPANSPQRRRCTGKAATTATTARHNCWRSCGTDITTGPPSGWPPGPPNRVTAPRCATSPISAPTAAGRVKPTPCTGWRTHMVTPRS